MHAIIPVPTETSTPCDVLKVFVCICWKCSKPADDGQHQTEKDIALMAIHSLNIMFKLYFPNRNGLTLAHAPCSVCVCVRISTMCLLTIRIVIQYAGVYGLLSLRLFCVCFVAFTIFSSARMEGKKKKRTKRLAAWPPQPTVASKY